ncbi:MAG: aldo/keto reductase [Halodesulfurarchaeum sp.]
MTTRSAGGAEVPILGFGTYQLYGENCVTAVRDALEMGYRHVDTAEFYDNHRAVGEGIDAATVSRDQVFLTTKVWKTNLERDRVLDVGRTALEQLGVHSLDLLLIHWPNESVPIAETVEAMNELQRDDVVRHIGVSNFSAAQLREAVEVSATPIVTNQVRYHPGRDRNELLELAHEEDLLITAYSPLAKGDLVSDTTLRNIGDRYGKTPAQVALRWLIQQPRVIAIPKAASRDHRDENRRVFDYSLTETEMRQIFDRGDGVPNVLEGNLTQEPVDP